MTTPVERLAGLVMGAVESVAPDEIRVLLDIDAPHATALNNGVPASFPRLNAYVLIPHEAGATVGYISWIGIERSPYPKRSGLKDFGLIDLPFPLRKMAVSPIGTLTTGKDRRTGAVKHELSRGVVAFPSVGDQVLMPTPDQIQAIVGARDEDRRVKIGTSTLAANAPIMVDPDKIFGRHLAVLGNTGSGKSCTVAGLVRWSLAAAQDRMAGHGAQNPNARFIVFDPNGEYAQAFADLGDRCRVFRVPPTDAPIRPLQVPAWMWNGHEWGAVAHAQPGVQRPLLMQGLRELKSGQMEGIPVEAKARAFLFSHLVRLAALHQQGTDFKTKMDAGRLVECIVADAQHFADSTEDGDLEIQLRAVHQDANRVLGRIRDGQYFKPLQVAEFESIKGSIQAVLDAIPEAGSTSSISEDAPIPFPIRGIADHLERIATEQGAGVAGFISTLGLRLRAMVADQRLGPIIAPEDGPTLEDWLNAYIGEDDAGSGPLAVIDLSLVPSDVVHTVIAVMARLVFEAQQRYRQRRKDGKALPTVLVLEEAHNFVRRGFEDEEAAMSSARLCREAFERIAREGRKFGLGLVLSSQRPSELSQTILAQCNTFILHRLVNDRDQDLVSRLVPDNLGGLLRELPSLPSRQAILLGWATPIPVLVEMNELSKAERPKSDDPDFWNVWTRHAERTIDWPGICADWTGLPIDLRG